MDEADAQFVAVPDVAPWGWTAGVLGEKGADRNSQWSPKRHGVGFAVAFCDGSARIIAFSQRDGFVGTPATWATNYPTMAVGENWDLDRP